MPDLRDAYRSLNPALPLAAEELDSLYVARPNHPVGMLAEELTIRPDPINALLTGQRGVGKSTDLGWLERRVSLADGLRAIVRVQTTALQNVAEVEVFLRNVAIELIRKSSRHAYMVMTPEFTNEKLGPLLVQKGLLEKHLSNDIVALFNTASKFHGDRIPVILVDGGERLDPLFSVQLIEWLNQLHASFVVAAPIQAVLNPEFVSYAEKWHRRLSLPAVSVTGAEGNTQEPGFGYFRSIVDRRCNGAFTFETLGLLVGASGGIHRELLELCQLACLRALVSKSTVVLPQHGHAAIAQRRQNFSILLTSEDLAYLRRLHTTGSFARDPIPMRLLELNLIVMYDEGWTNYQVHPLILPHLQKIASLAS